MQFKTKQYYEKMYGKFNSKLLKLLLFIFVKLFMIFISKQLFLRE